MCALGSVDIKPQIAELKPVEILVATPGRLLDHVENKSVSFSSVQAFVSTKPTACSTWASSPM